MKIKTKLRLGLGLLFFLIVLLSSVATLYMYALKNDTQNILNDNYNSLVYAKGMMRSLNDQDGVNLQLFSQCLIKQEANATEQGEKELNQTIRNRFEAYNKDTEKHNNTLNELRTSVLEVMEMNMQAIQIKSEFAGKTSDEAVLWILFTGAACVFIALNALLTLPSNVADPIEKLTMSIRQIAADNYSERIYLHKENEFGELARSFNSMAAKLEVYNNSHLANLLKQKSRMETLINNMHDAVLGLDENMQVIFANHEAEKITGLKEEDMVSKNAKDLALHNDLIRLLIQDMLSDKKGQQQIRIMADAKENHYTKEVFHIEIIPAGERMKQFVGHVIILRNITEFKELDAAKTRFIATVSHEFKTPISSMEMSLRLLKNEQIGALNEEQYALVKSIDEDVHRLLNITRELLELTQMENGVVQMRRTQAAPADILKGALGSNQLLADAKKLQFDLIVQPEMHNVFVDVEKTIWVLANLITNAVHYSHNGARIWISVNQNEKETFFTVKDEGIGIPSEYLDKVFDRYFRVPGTHREGTGLGLTISKEFIEAQNGSLEVRSEYGAGSEFVMRIVNNDPT